ncbi:hypothetical protein E2562_004405 [Oryza meyeriana var. granulata]|uniref:Uncharacterized protein n=1 Tax=Oryza meyeriana var. granulata TaxID=110450 RepID=A0A6G1CZ80_9ORYZ|nr:hypothetical protein E2562_004405 [Oryza meyeriana var. granulata]
MKSVVSRSRGSVLALVSVYTTTALALLIAAMESAKRSYLAISLILLLLLAPTVHGARHVAAVKGTEVGGEMVTTVRTATAGHGHGTSHRSHNPNNPEDGGSGTPTVDPHNVATRGHHHRNTASRTVVGDPRLATCMLLGATFLLLVLV